MYHGTKRSALMNTNNKYDLIITTYAVVRIEACITNGKVDSWIQGNM